MKRLLVAVSCLAACPLFARTINDGQMAFLKEQAYAEMQRVDGQLDVLQNNCEDLRRRVSKLENKGDQGVRAEIDSLKSAIAELRRQMSEQRSEIVKELSSKLVKLQSAAQPKPEPKPVEISGPHYEYVVQSGDSLYLIAKAFNTTIAKIKEMNALKSDNLKIGQKLNVPKE